MENARRNYNISEVRSHQEVNVSTAQFHGSAEDMAEIWMAVAI